MEVPALMVTDAADIPLVEGAYIRGLKETPVGIPIPLPDSLIQVAMDAVVNTGTFPSPSISNSDKSDHCGAEADTEEDTGKQRPRHKDQEGEAGPAMPLWATPSPQHPKRGEGDEAVDTVTLYVIHYYCRFKYMLACLTIS